jgi:hypothetical protein
MGKRELVIIIAFVVVGGLTYRFTAPPPKEGEQPFSIRNLFTGIRKEISANAASTTITKEGVLALRPEATEVRLDIGRSPVTVIGEPRKDLAYELSVYSTGPDETTAAAYARRVELVDDDLGSAQALSLSYPPEATQSARVTLRVPSSLLVRLETSGRANVSGVRAVDLRNLAGEVTLTDVAERVTGSHRSGDLTITRAGGLDLTLASSRAHLKEITGPISLNGRNGECEIAGSSGTIEAMVTSVDVTVTDHTGSIRVSGDNGSLSLVRPANDLSVDVRRMLVELVLAAAIPATIITTDEPLRVTLSGPAPMTIDAVAVDGGSIRANDLGVEPTHQDRETRWSLTIGEGGPRVVLRNARGDIVIGHGK